MENKFYGTDPQERLIISAVHQEREGGEGGDQTVEGEGARMPKLSQLPALTPYMNTRMVNTVIACVGIISLMHKLTVLTYRQWRT